MRGKLWVGVGSIAALACGGPPAGAPLPAQLSLLHTSDVHSRLWPFRERIASGDARLGLGPEGELAEVGGAARLATLLAEQRQRGAALWLDSGDLLEGAPVFGSHRGAVEVELWGALGVAAMALGNHELSLGAAELEARFAAARFPVLAANLRGGEAWRSPSTTVFAGRTPLGIVGAANVSSPPSLASESNTWGLSVVPTAASVQDAIDALSPRVALVIVVSHMGLEADRELVRQTSGIGVLLGGHQHTLTRQPEWQLDCDTRKLQQARGCSSRRVPIVHSGAYGRYLSRLDLRLRPNEQGTVDVQHARLEHLPAAPDVVEDEPTSAWLEAYRAPPEPPLAYLAEPLTRSAASGGDSTLGNLVTDAVRAETGADVVLLNRSGLRDDLEAGPLLVADLELAFPFQEPWRLAWLSARDLEEGLERSANKSAVRGCDSALEVSGLWWRVRCGACQDTRTRCWRAGRGDRELTRDARLLVALPQYLTSPGADFEAIAQVGAELPLSVTEALRRHVARQPRVTDTRDCARALEGASRARCAAAFGVACPMTTARAHDVCRQLPLVRGARDGRIDVRP